MNFGTSYDHLPLTSGGHCWVLPEGKPERVDSHRDRGAAIANLPDALGQGDSRAGGGGHGLHSGLHA